MSIDKNQLRYEEFLKNEIHTLSFIKGFSSLQSVFPSLSNHAYMLFYQLSGKKLSEIDFSFGCELKMEIEERPKDHTIVFIEANLKRNYSESVYTLCICDNTTEPKTLFRKFHFDYDPQKKPEVLDKKPKYHLQYGGLPTPKLEEHKVSTDVVDNWLSVPRLSSTPVCLALLLDMVFTEFQSEDTIKIIEKQEWRDLIKKNEEIILGTYFTNVNNFLNREHRSDNLLREFMYG